MEEKKKRMVEVRGKAWERILELKQNMHNKQVGVISTNDYSFVINFTKKLRKIKELDKIIILINENIRI